MRRFTQPPSRPGIFATRRAYSPSAGVKRMLGSRSSPPPARDRIARDSVRGAMPLASSEVITAPELTPTYTSARVKSSPSIASSSAHSTPTS